MSPNSDEKTSKLFSQYLKGKRILIADKSPASRLTISRALELFGADSKKIDQVPSFSLAERQLSKFEYHIVVTDYTLGKECGLDLIQNHRVKFPESKNTLFILVTRDNSQSAVARSAEEDVDTFIVKPFSSLIFRDRVLRAARDKLFQGIYRETIDQGKKLVDKCKFKEAIERFEEAKGLDSIPSLAYFYKAQTYEKMEDLKSAEDEYLKGLSLNRIHYRCLNGLFKLYLEIEEYHYAYNVVKRIANYYPANSKRLTDVVRLAVMSDHVVDIEQHYRVFKGLGQKDSELVRYLAAGLMTCARFYLKRKTLGRALELFEKASDLVNGSPRLLREIITFLVDHNFSKYIEQYLKKFSKDSLDGIDCRISLFVILHSKSEPYEVVEAGTKLLEEGVFDPVIYRILIIAYKRVDMGAALEATCEEAIEKYPDQKDRFIELKEGVSHKIS